jgi:CRP-like cAMP-binding protein
VNGLEDTLNDLSDFSFFGGINPEALRAVLDLFGQGSYDPGTRIIEEGSRGKRLYIVTSGRTEVRVRFPDPGGDEPESVIATNARGDTFGEMELLDTQERSASVVAIEATTTIELTNNDLYEIFRRRPDVFRMIMMNLARDLSRRLRLADRQLAEVRVAEPSP